MEFHDLGKHCASESCGQQDFLPFKCDACEGVFCLDHRTHSGHNCSNANFKDKRVLECSKCSKVLKRPSGVAHSVLLQRHVASGCVEGVRKARPNKLSCSAQGCRNSEFVKVSCMSCRKNFCFRHRHEDDHKCDVAAAQAHRQQQQKRGGSRGVTPQVPRKPTAKDGIPGLNGSGKACGTEAGEAAALRQRAASERQAANGVAAR